jgi:predicted N-acetyltransferase YhbS
MTVDHASTTALTRAVTAADAARVGGLHARVFGPGRFARTAYRVREGTPFHSRYCRLAMIGDRLVAALRLTPVCVGGRPGALLLGPLAVDPEFANLGHGRRLIRESLDMAASDGRSLVVLVGDTAYYGRLGFAPVLPPGRIRLPGPADPARILARDLVPGAGAAASGLVTREP